MMRSKIVEGIGLFISLVYILLRPFLNTYFTENIKYIFILTVVFLTLSFFLSKKRINKYSKSILLLVVFWIYAIFSSLINGGSELLLYTVERYIFYNLIFFVCLTIVNRINWIHLFKFLVAYGVVDAVVSIIEFFTQKQMFAIGGVTHSIVQLYGDNSLRTFGLNGNYFLLAELLCVCAFVSLYLYKETNKKIYLFSLLVISFGIFCSGSRGYYVAFTCGMFLIFFFYTFEKGTTKKTFIIFLSIVAVLISALLIIFFTDIHIGLTTIDRFLDRFRSITDFSSNAANVTRFKLWINAINEWRTHFWFGNGASCTDLRYSAFKNVTESGLLKRFVELGLIGTMLQYSSMLFPIIKGIKKYKNNKSLNRFDIPFFAIILVFFVEDLILQRYGEIEYTTIMWFSIAVVYCSPMINIKNDNNTRTTIKWRNKV